MLGVKSNGFVSRVASASVLLFLANMIGCSAHAPQENTIEVRLKFPAAACDQGRPLLNWEAPIQNAPTAACVRSGSIQLREPVRPPAQFSNHEFGTIIVLSISREKVVVAADSRATLVNPQTGAIVGYNDTACKLIEVRPQLLFAVTGMATTGSRVPVDVQYNAMNVAREISQNFRFDTDWIEPNRMVEAMAEEWGWYVDFRIRRGIEGGWLKPTPVWLEGIFVGIEPNGELSLAIARLQYGKPRAGFIVPPVQLSIESPVPPKSFTWIQAFGLSDATEAFYSSARVTDATNSEYRRIGAEQTKTSLFPPEIPERLVELTIEHHEKLLKQGSLPGLFVNRPVDVAVLSTSKKTVQWACD